MKDEGARAAIFALGFAVMKLQRAVLEISNTLPKDQRREVVAHIQVSLDQVGDAIDGLNEGGDE